MSDLSLHDWGSGALNVEFVRQGEEWLPLQAEFLRLNHYVDLWASGEDNDETLRQHVGRIRQAIAIWTGEEVESDGENKLHIEWTALFQRLASMISTSRDDLEGTADPFRLRDLSQKLENILKLWDIGERDRSVKYNALKKQWRKQRRRVMQIVQSFKPEPSSPSLTLGYQVAISKLQQVIDLWETGDSGELIPTLEKNNLDSTWRILLARFKIMIQKLRPRLGNSLDTVGLNQEILKLTQVLSLIGTGPPAHAASSNSGSEPSIAVSPSQEQRKLERVTCEMDAALQENARWQTAIDTSLPPSYDEFAKLDSQTFKGLNIVTYPQKQTRNPDNRVKSPMKERPARQHKLDNCSTQLKSYSKIEASPRESQDFSDEDRRADDQIACLEKRFEDFIREISDAWAMITMSLPKMSSAVRQSLQEMEELLERCPKPHRDILGSEDWQMRRKVKSTTIEATPEMSLPGGCPGKILLDIKDGEDLLEQVRRLEKELAICKSQIEAMGIEKVNHDDRLKNARNEAAQVGKRAAELDFELRSAREELASVHRQFKELEDEFERSNGAFVSETGNAEEIVERKFKLTMDKIDQFKKIKELYSDKARLNKQLKSVTEQRDTFQVGETTAYRQIASQKMQISELEKQLEAESDGAVSRPGELVELRARLIESEAKQKEWEEKLSLKLQKYQVLLDQTKQGQKTIIKCRATSGKFKEHIESKDKALGHLDAELPKAMKEEHEGRNRGDEALQLLISQCADAETSSTDSLAVSNQQRENIDTRDKQLTEAGEATKELPTEDFYRSRIDLLQTRPVQAQYVTMETAATAGKKDKPNQDLEANLVAAARVSAPAPGSNYGPAPALTTETPQQTAVELDAATPRPGSPAGKAEAAEHARRELFDLRYQIYEQRNHAGDSFAALSADLEQLALDRRAATAGLEKPLHALVAKIQEIKKTAVSSWPKHGRSGAASAADTKLDQLAQELYRYKFQVYEMREFAGQCFGLAGQDLARIVEAFELKGTSLSDALGTLSTNMTKLQARVVVDGPKRSWRSVQVVAPLQALQELEQYYQERETQALADGLIPQKWAWEVQRPEWKDPLKKKEKSGLIGVLGTLALGYKLVQLLLWAALVAMLETKMPREWTKWVFLGAYGTP